MLHYLNNFIAFLFLNIDFTFYKNYFDFFCKILGISNNKKKKQHGQVVVVLEIELEFLLIKTQLLANKFDKTKLYIIRVLSCNVIKYNNLQPLANFFSFAAKMI